MHCQINIDISVSVNYNDNVNCVFLDYIITLVSNSERTNDGLKNHSMC